MERQYDAIIIGAGPAGSSAAILLARAGWHVVLIEKKSFPRRKVCGECIAASNLPLLDALGIGEDFAALAGPPLRQVALMAGERTIHAELPPYDHPAHRWGAALGREHLDTLLLSEARACGVQVHQPWTARHIEESEGGPGNFRCTIEHTDLRKRLTIAAPVLIDAHGSWEALPSSGEMQRERRRPSDLFAFKANFTGTALEPGLLPVLSFPGGYGGMVIADHATMTLAFCMRRDALAACRQEASDATAAEAAVAHVMRSCAGVRKALAGAVQSGAWLAVGPLRPGIRLPSRGDGIFRIGNSAGEAHPIIGEGMSMAIQSAWLLAGMLAPSKGRCADRNFLASLQNDYAKAWRRQFAPRMRLAALFAQAAMRPSLFGHVLPLLQRYPQILTMAARWSGKIRCVPIQEAGIYNLALQGDRAA